MVCVREYSIWFIFNVEKTSYPAIDTPYEKCTTYFTLWTLWVNSLDGLFINECSIIMQTS